MEREIRMQHRGREILLHDYAGLAEEEYTLLVKHLGSTIVTSQAKGVLLLINVKDSFVTTPVLEAFKAASKEIRPHVAKVAVVGLSAIHRFFLTIVNQFSSVGAVPFDSKEKAMDWLAE